MAFILLAVKGSGEATSYFRCCYGMSGYEMVLLEVDGIASRSYGRIRPHRIGTEVVPVGVKLTAQLAHAAGAQTVPLAHLQRPLATHQIVDHAPVPDSARREPGREVEPECRLVRRRGLAIIQERLG